MSDQRSNRYTIVDGGTIGVKVNGLKGNSPEYKPRQSRRI